MSFLDIFRDFIVNNEYIVNKFEDRIYFHILPLNITPSKWWFRWSVIDAKPTYYSGSTSPAYIDYSVDIDILNEKPREIFKVSEELIDNLTSQDVDITYLNTVYPDYEEKGVYTAVISFNVRFTIN